MVVVVLDVLVVPVPDTVMAVVRATEFNRVKLYGSKRK